jgi:DNA-binding protein H-NS
MNQTRSDSSGIPTTAQLAKMSPDSLKQLQQRIMEAQVEKLLQDHADAKREYNALLERVGEKVLPFGLTSVKFLTMTPQQLQKHLMQVARGEVPSFAGGGNRPINRVPPRYRNPANPDETWTGRGNRPGWVKAHVEAGGKLESILIPQDEANEDSAGSQDGGQKGDGTGSKAG